MTTNGLAYAQVIHHATHARLSCLVEPRRGYGEQARPRDIQGGTQ
ncbi:hypothetical protein [Burkholderia gladioli]|nr:hypothetical protein [Burkholderia gladioli]MDN7806392.1 hypothetical protein [Burkholderia gladioli]